jgi:tetratricopeptide (TPR) repeat protein
VTESAASAYPHVRNLVWGREIPFRNRHFTGRDRELTELRRQLTDTSAAVIGQPALPLYGLGGVGKTEIAAEYAHRYRDDYELIWWIRCEREALIVNSLLALGRRLELPDFRVDERDYSVGLVIGALNRGEPFATWLLIFDNATDADMVSKYIPQGAGHVIVTSRHSQWRRALRADGIEVSEFDAAETVEFLRKRVPALAETSSRAEAERRAADAAELAKELDNLPLAAEHAAAYLVEYGISVREYLVLYRSNAHKLLATEVDISYPHAVATTWNVSRSSISPDADALFRLLAFFAPEPIYEELLRLPAPQHGAAALLPEPLDRVLTDATEFRRAARQLARISLIKINPVRNVLQVHRVVQAVTQGQLLRDDPAAAQRFRAAAHTLLAASDPNAPDRDDSDDAYERSRQHLVPSGALESPNPLVRRLIRNQVRRLHRRGGYAESLSLGELTLRTWQEKFQPNDRDTLALAVEIGWALRRVGRLEEALNLDATTMQGLSSEYSEEDPVYLACARSYGVDLYRLGRYSDALESDLRLLPLYDRVFEPEDLNSLYLRNDIAIILRCLGRFDEALRYDEEVLAVRERILGAVDTGTLTSRFAIARDIRRLGRYDDALDGIRAVADVLEQKGAPWDQFRLMVGVDLATCLRRVGYYSDAADVAREIHDRYIRVFGEADRETLWASISIMNCLRTADDLVGAQELGEKTLAGWMAAAGPAHPNTMAAQVNLAVALRERGNPARALDFDKKALDVFIRLFGEAHPSPIVVMTNLASDLAATGEVSQAREMGERALDLSRAARGPRHHSTLAIAANLSLDRRAVGDTEGAEALFSETMTAIAETLGADHVESRRAVQRGRLNLDIGPMHT